MHVDDFIDSHYGKDKYKYARWWFSLFRLPAVLKADFAEWTSQYRLYCDYGGKRFRVTGCSRMGDVWLHEDLVNEHTSEGGSRAEFYQLRVPDVMQCSAWGPTP